MSQGIQAYREFDGLEDAAQDGATSGSVQPPPLDMMCEDLDVFCESHINLASEAAVGRKRQMQRRLAFVQSVWNDPERFEQIVTSGRYLKLCNLTEWISDYDERAWERVKTEILAARGELATAAE
ncbi:MAG: hypothetical protein ACLP8A_11165 [Methylovirgula sp.]